MDRSGENNSCYRHGHAYKGKPSPTYRVWAGMKTRCSNSKQPAWGRYGGAGITVCKEWNDSFEAFLRDMGPRPPGKTLDRIRGSEGYSKANCRWATPKEQAMNSSAVKLVVINGKTMNLMDAAKELGVDRTLFTKRIASGLTPQQAVDKPIGSRSAALKKSWAQRKATI